MGILAQRIDLDSFVESGCRIVILALRGVGPSQRVIRVFVVRIELGLFFESIDGVVSLA